MWFNKGKSSSASRFRRTSVGVGVLSSTIRGNRTGQTQEGYMDHDPGRFHGYAHNGLGEIIRLLTTKAETLLDPNRQED